jgi:hypothetical protein
MGMDQKVVFEQKQMPSWAEVVDLLATRKLPIQLRMVDGELALPDETPPHDWRELRVSTPGGMVTLRRETDGVTFVIWGNADANMQKAWNTLTWALAHLTGGKVRSTQGEQLADAFAKTAELPDGFP